MSTSLAHKAFENLHAIRRTKPLIHNITNFVVMNSWPTLLRLAEHRRSWPRRNEVEEMVALAGALVLNIGTLSDSWITAMLKAGKTATRLGKPIVLDPVGAGATRLRTDTAEKILAQTKVGVVRGNASEILSLAGESFITKGVDAVRSVKDAVSPAMNLARKLNVTLAVTGVTDLVTDGRRVLYIDGGHPLMPWSGTATASALVAHFTPWTRPGFSGGHGSPFERSWRKAGQTATGPGTFQTCLLDALYTLSPEDLSQLYPEEEN